MKSILSSLTVLFTCLYFTTTAQVVVNELSAANYDGGFIDNYSEYEDWIELYNTTGAAIDLSGYWLSDDELEPMKWEIPAGTSIGANDYLLIYASGRDESIGGNLHTSFKITQAKQEGAVLSDPSGTILDSFLLITPNQVNHSRGRTSDGAADWSVFQTPTPGAANAGPSDEYPVMSIDTDPGYYSGTVSVSITGASALNDIYYTLDGSEPTAASTLYTGPISLSTTTVVRARAISVSPGTPMGFVETNTYFLNETHTIPIVSVSGDELLTLVNGTQIEPIGHFELFDENGVLLAEGGGDFNEHGNDSWAYPQRGIDYITQDEFGYGNELNYPIFPSKDRDGYQRLILKAAASDNYPFENGGAHIRDAYVQSLSQVADLRMDERTYEPAVMYVNGQYWGVYEIREKVDDLDFTDHYYDQGAGDVDFLKTWGGTWEEYGSADDWDDLRDFILGNDMTDQANYDYVKDLYNTGSLIDYFTLNSYIVSSDWLNWNTGWWRGRNPDGDKKKWRYILWDMDASFDHYANFTGIPNQGPDANLCDPQQFGDPGGQGHVPIWNALVENEEFFADYINRFSDLSGTYFSCDFMIQHLDSLVDRIEPEMQAHIDRWGGDMAEWQGNVQNIRDFITERCAVVNEGILECYDDLEGPYEITLLANPPEGGRIDLPSLEIDTYPFTTTYFGGIDASFDADENPGFVFSHWTATNGTVFTPDDLSEEITVSFTQNDTLTAHFVAEEFYEITINAIPADGGTITFNGTVYDTFPVTVEVPGAALNQATATPETGWGLQNWTSTFLLSPTILDLDVEFTAENDGTLTANFFEIIYEIGFSVSPPEVADIILNGDVLEPLPNSVSLPGDIPIPVSTAPTRPFYEFTHWSSLNTTPLPDEFTSDVEMTFEGNDLIVANYVELPNYDIILEVEPEGAGWIRVEDTLVKDFPYTSRELGDELIKLIAIDRGKYEFDYWEVIYGVQIDNKEVPGQDYYFGAPARIVAHYDERISAVYIPTSFTPNGDGINDIFKVVATEIELSDFRFSVLNRWGQEIFSTTDINEGWNGSMEGGDYFVQPGIYTYFVRYTNSVTGEIVERFGSVTLIR